VTNTKISREELVNKYSGKQKLEKINKFRDLIVWQKAHNLVLQIYEITKFYPSEEKFGLISQMRRSAISVTANIA
jgi:hypothetical protein